MERLLARQPTGGGVDDHAIFNVDFAARLLVADFEDAGITSEALNLDDIRQSHLLQCAGKTFALRPRQQIVEDIENKLDAVWRDRFFQKQFRAVRRGRRRDGFQWRCRS